MSLIADVRGDVADYLTALPLSGVVESVIPPVDQREELAAREIHVWVDTRETTLASRSCKTNSLAVWVAILEPLVVDTEETQLEAVNVVVDSIIAAMLGKRTGGTANGMCTAAEQPAVLSPRHWNEYRQIATFLKLTIET